MNKRWIIGVAFLGISFFAFSKGEAVNISYQEYKINDRIIITAPLLFDMQNEETEKSLNEAFLESAKKYLNSIPEREELTKAGRFDFISNYEVPYNEEDYLSILQKNYLYAGGAHGNTYYILYNYDMKIEKPIVLQDLFKEGVDTKALLTPLVREELVASGRSKNLFDLSQVFVEKDTKFYLTHTGLVLLYGAYEIAPYSEGAIRIHIPWWKIQNQRK